jgi:hypothetical protein
MMAGRAGVFAAVRRQQEMKRKEKEIDQWVE